MTAEVRSQDPLVAVCMATHDPPDLLFEKQIASIRRQTHGRFICIISDDASSEQAWRRIQSTVGADPRFSVSRVRTRLGFYGNFERALSLVPPDVTYVALADQDDEWHADKLAVLRAAIEASGAELAYSDMTIVDESGRTLRTSYWKGRRNAATDVGSLLLMNTVTGAASLFRRDLLKDALPFPPRVGAAYHDHWIASVALARGAIQYVDRPLYDYVQHGSNVAGAFEASPQFRGGLVHALRRFAANPRARVRSSLDHGPEYADEVARVELFARTLEERLGGRLDDGKRAVLRRLSRLTSPGNVLWLMARSARDVRGHSETLGAELQLLKGIAWRSAHARRRPVRTG